MGTTHFTSSLVMKDGATITGGTVTATVIAGGTSVTAPAIVSSSYVKLGSHQYILFGGLGVAASVAAAATAIDSAITGGIYVGTKKVFKFDSETAPATLAATAVW